MESSHIDFVNEKRHMDVGWGGGQLGVVVTRHNSVSWLHHFLNYIQYILKGLCVLVSSGNYTHVEILTGNS